MTYKTAVTQFKLQTHVKQLRALQTENARLKKLLAERDLSIEIMKEINAKKW